MMQVTPRRLMLANDNCGCLRKIQEGPVPTSNK